MMNKGFRQTDIAREHGVSRQYVNKLAKQGGYESISTEVGENFPWEITPEMYTNTVYHALRLYGHWRVDPEAIEGSSRAKVRALLRKLELFNQVIDYDPDYPAMPGLTNTPGFAYLPRQGSDEDFVMRIKPGVRVTPLGDRIWRMPDTWP